MTRHDEPEDVLSSIRRLVVGDGMDRPDGTDTLLPILLLGPAVRVPAPEDASGMTDHRVGGRVAAPGTGVEPAYAAQDGRKSLADAMRLGADASLRAMVAEVVREELAGELGERMTRNLRQLVLRELRAANSTGAPSRPGPAGGT